MRWCASIPGAAEPEQTALAGKSRNHSRSVPRLVREAGFWGVRRAWHGYRGTLDTVEEFLEIQQTYSSLARKRLSGALPAQREAVCAEFISRCGDVLARGGRLVYPYAALFVTARRP